VIRSADYVTPLNQQTLALTSPTGGDRSVGRVRSWTQAMEFAFSINTIFNFHYIPLYINRNLKTKAIKYTPQIWSDYRKCKRKTA
jgi:hypothetical protein